MNSSGLPSLEDMFWSISLFEYTHVEVWVVTVILNLIRLCGAVGNVTLITTIAKNNIFHASGYILMANLAIGDLIAATANGVSNVVSLLWFYDRSLRVPFSLLDGLALTNVMGYNITVFTMTVISVNRLCSVVYYTRYTDIFSIRNTAVMVVLLYLLSILSLVPIGPGVGLAIYSYHPRLWMYFFDPFRGAYNAVVFNGFQAVAGLAVVIMITIYVVVIHKLRRIRKVRGASSSSSSSATDSGRGVAISRDDILLCIQFFIVTFIFVVSWVFLSVYVIVSPSITSTLANKCVITGLLVVWQVNFGINPFIYITVNQRLRKHMNLTLTCSTADIQEGNNTRATTRTAAT